ncbi:sensor histidine kinase [Actinomadura physcomitrii]|uniref:sensor histidine kinase n=1 Tax=Actinomadura physcomitrii TaxID=2650748 RepID=UPI00136FE553|nr:ATP-binding protein [Actinomadura physcomitrii]
MDDHEATLLASLAQLIDCATDGDIDETLTRIVDVADTVISESVAATIVLVDGRVSSGLRLAACHGLSRHYRDTMENDPDQFRASLAARAIRGHRALLARDVLGDPEFERWWRFAREEGYRSILASPMLVNGSAIGSLNIYRGTTDDLRKDEVLLVEMFARVAAGVLQTSLLLNDRDNQVTALARLVRALQDQAHEHSNRLQAIRGLIAIGEAAEALNFITEISHATSKLRSEVGTRINQPTIAGLLVALSEVAAQQDIAVEIDEDSSLDRLPATLSDSQMVTLVGNLVDNAIAAVADEPADRRRVRVSVRTGDGSLNITVRDCGSGMSMPLEDATAWGASSRAGHLGAGLSLVSRIVKSAMGVIEVSSNGSGTTFVVRVPLLDDR